MGGAHAGAGRYIGGEILWRSDLNISIYQRRRRRRRRPLGEQIELSRVMALLRRSSEAGGAWLARSVPLVSEKFILPYTI